MLEPIDAVINEHFDMKREELQHELSSQAHEVDVRWYGVPCNTLSAIRNNPIPNHLNPDGQLPLTAAIRKGNLEIVKSLIENHADINKTDSQKF